MTAETTLFWGLVFAAVGAAGTLVSISTAIYALGVSRRARLAASAIDVGREVMALPEFVEKVEHIASKLDEVVLVDAAAEAAKTARATSIDQITLHLNRDRYVLESQHQNDMTTLTARMDRFETRLGQLPAEVAQRFDSALTAVNGTLQAVLMEVRKR